MAWVTGIGDDRVRVAPRVEAGRKGVVFPVLEDESQAVNLTLPGCKSCSKRADHGSPCCQMGRTVEVGQHPLDGIEEEEKFTAEFLHKAVCGHWATGMFLNGTPVWLPWNFSAGTANNTAQELELEIVSVVSSRRLRVRGANPKRITTGKSVRNPEWPLEAPAELRPPGMSDEDWNGRPTAVPPYSDGIKYAALIPSSMSHCLPLGAMVGFGAPSVLHGKLTPYITRIHPPEGEELTDVEWEMELSHPVTNAMQPYDLAYPPGDGKYRLVVYYYAINPEGWPNFQELTPAWFTRAEKVLTGAELATAAGIVALRRSDEGEGRVLFPSMGTGVLTVSYTRTGVGLVTMSDAEVTAALTTTDTGTGWVSELDLSALVALGDVDSVRVKFCPEAVEGDAPVFAVQGSCSDSQKDWTGSYIHGDGEKRCMNIACSKWNAGTYRDECWDPKATGFVRGYGVGLMPITNPRESDWLSKMWSECSLVLAQGVPGLNVGRNFWIERAGRPSLQEWVGGFSDTVPNGKFARKAPLYIAAMGQRYEYLNPLDEVQHRLIHGAFFARTFEDGTDLGFVGAFPELVTGWGARIGQRRETLMDVAGDFPRWGPAGMRLYEHTGLTNGLAAGKRISGEAREMYITGQVLGVVNGEVEAEVRGAFEG